MKNDKIAELLIDGIVILKSIHKKNLEENKSIEDFLKSVNNALGLKEEEKEEEPKKKEKTKTPLEEKSDEFKEELEKYKKYMEKLTEASKMPAPYVVGGGGTTAGDWVDATTTSASAIEEPKEVVLPEETEPNWKEGDEGHATEGFKESVGSDASGGGMAGKIWCAVCNEYHDKDETVTSHTPPTDTSF